MSMGIPRRRGPGVDAAIGLVGVVFVAVAVRAAMVADVAAVDDRGLGSALPLGYWVGLLGLNLAFAVSLGRRSAPLWVSVSLLAGLVTLLYGVASFVSDIPRNAVAYRHLGIAEALAAGGVDPNIDVYFNWPGFFAGLTTFIHSTGLPPVQVALWAPMVNVTFWSVAVLAVLRVFTRDRSRLLLAVWIFLLGNWIDQDYLAPQAFGVLLYMAVIALAVSVLAAVIPGAPTGMAQLWSRAPRLPENPDARQRVVGLLVVLLLTAAAVASHQLTPAMMIVSLGALTVLRRSWAPWLPLLVGLFLLLWLAYPASTYLLGHPPFGNEGAEVVAANVSQRVSGSQGHLDVLRVRMALTAGLWALALVGAVVDWRGGRRDLRPFALATVPFLLLPTQSYGGEMLLRVTLFTLPFVAYFAARALLPLSSSSGRLGRWRAVALVLVCSVLAVASITARYGNARFDMFSAAEVQAVEKLGELAAPGSVLVAGAPSTPWGADNYDQYKRRSVQSLCAEDYRPAPCLATLAALSRHEGEQGLTLLLTRGNQASLRMRGDMSSADFVALEAGVRELQGSELLFRNRDARIYRIGTAAPEVTP